MTHKIIYSNLPGNAPNNDTLTAYGGITCFAAFDSMLQVAQGTDINTRIGNRINVLFNTFHAMVQGNANCLLLNLDPPNPTAIWMFEVWAVKGQFANLVANIDAYIAPGGVVSDNNVATIVSAPQAIDPALVGFWIKKTSVFSLPESSTNPGPNVVTRFGKNFRKFKFKGKIGELMYYNFAATTALTERPYYLFLNTYNQDVTLILSNKTVFVDAVK